MKRRRLPFTDPYWLEARFPSQCARCGRQIARGESIFYFPNSRTVFCKDDDCGLQEARDLAAALHDERMLAS